MINGTNRLINGKKHIKIKWIGEIGPGSTQYVPITDIEDILVPLPECWVQIEPVLPDANGVYDSTAKKSPYDDEASDNDVGDNNAGDNDAGDNDAGDNDAGDNDAGDNDAGDNDLDDNDTGDNYVDGEGGNNATGDNGNAQNGKDDGDSVTNDNVTNDNVAGDNAAGDNAAGDNAAGDNAAGDNGASDNDAGDKDPSDNDTFSNGTGNGYMDTSMQLFEKKVHYGDCSFARRVLSSVEPEEMPDDEADDAWVQQEFAEPQTQEFCTQEFRPHSQEFHKMDVSDIGNDTQMERYVYLSTRV